MVSSELFVDVNLCWWDLWRLQYLLSSLGSGSSLRNLYRVWFWNFSSSRSSGSLGSLNSGSTSLRNRQGSHWRRRKGVSGGMSSSSTG